MEGGQKFYNLVLSFCTTCVVHRGGSSFLKRGVKVLILLATPPSNFYKEISINSEYFKCSKQKITLLVCKNVSTLELHLQFFHSICYSIYKICFRWHYINYNIIQLQYYILYKIKILTAKGSGCFFMWLIELQVTPKGCYFKIVEFSSVLNSYSLWLTL